MCGYKGSGRGIEGFGVEVIRDNLRVLGVTFDRDGKGKRAWEELQGRVKEVVGWWGTTGLSLGGKAEVIKRFLLPVVLFTGRVYPLSWAQARKVQREICLFFGGGQSGEGGKERNI